MPNIETKRPLVLVTGSTAIDQTGFYEDEFEAYEAQYAVKAFNASFQLADMRTSFGGCAPNIAYGLNLLGIEAIPLSSAGRNFRDQYEGHLNRAGIDTRFITVDDEVANCASCLMINDASGNQIIGFYPGPKNPKRHLPREIPGIKDVDLAILGPEEPALTLRQARDLHNLEVTMMMDPGQVTARFSRQDVEELLGYVSFLVLNDHELDVIKANAELTTSALIDAVDELVVTHGATGVTVYRGSQVSHVAAVPDVEIVEVTGCGDAFRAGYAFGLVNGYSLETRAQFGCIMASINLAVPETQRYRTTADALIQAREEIYG